jgi:hypothetical protein
VGKRPDIDFVRIFHSDFGLVAYRLGHDTHFCISCW